jgi:hypothetical protein
MIIVNDSVRGGQDCFLRWLMVYRSSKVIYRCSSPEMAHRAVIILEMNLVHIAL